MARGYAGLVLVMAGAGLVLVGILVWAGAFSWFGRLPGDVRIERSTYRVYVPITSMVLLSVILSLVLWIVAAVLRRFR